MRTIVISIFFMFILSCEDVVNVPLQESKPKLVIDASIRWIKGTNGALQIIRISKSGSFYSNDVPKVSGAIVKIKSDNPSVSFDFIEQTPNSGEYICANFVPELEKNYVLTVTYEGQTYIAEEKLKKCPPITRIEQKNDVGFGGDNKSFKFFFQDDPNEENFYLENYIFEDNPRPSFGVIDDKLTNGNEMFVLTFNKIDSGKFIKMSLEAVSKRYSNYVDKVAALAGGQTNGPFSTPPGTIRGNIVNQTNEKNFPLGYFRLSEIDFKDYKVE